MVIVQLHRVCKGCCLTRCSVRSLQVATCSTGCWCTLQFLAMYGLLGPPCPGSQHVSSQYSPSLPCHENSFALVGPTSCAISVQNCSCPDCGSRSPADCLQWKLWTPVHPSEVQEVLYHLQTVFERTKLNICIAMHIALDQDHSQIHRQFGDVGACKSNERPGILPVCFAGNPAHSSKIWQVPIDLWSETTMYMHSADCHLVILILEGCYLTGI